MIHKKFIILPQIELFVLERFLMQVPQTYPNSDLEQIAISLGPDVYRLKNSKILITGGSGFVGTWLISSLLYLDAKFSLNLRIISNSRTLETYKLKLNQEVINKIEIIIGNAADLDIGKLDLDFVFYGSTSTTEKSLSLGSSPALHSGALRPENLIRQASRKHRLPTFVHLSSGAVYGPQLQKYEPRKTSEPIEPPTRRISFSEVYQDTKVKTEKMVELSHELGLVTGINARLFAFYGPGLPTNQQFAIGNFMRDALTRDRVIRILGNPNSIRSYMHASELTYCLIKLAVDQKPGKFNVGAPNGDSILNWANRVAGILGSKISVETVNSQISFYVPNMEETPQLNFIPRLDFDGYTREWAAWLAPQL
jgi:dTDP-glucose 4,6-dehydratase